MVGAPVPDRPNIHSNRVPAAAKWLKYVCFLGFQDNRLRHPQKRPQRRGEVSAARQRLVRSMPLLISSIQAATAFSRVRKCGGPWTVRPSG
jgi:hypothetical protein